MQIFILIFVILLSSYLIGEVVGLKFSQINDIIKYKLPIGFFIYLGFFQLASFGLTYFHVSMQIVQYIFGGVYLALIIGSLLILYGNVKKTKNFQYYKALNKKKSIDYLFIIGFILYHFFITFNSNSLCTTTADQTFYINLVNSNVNADSVNMIHPLTGVTTPLQAIYNFQSFYLVISFLAQSFNITPLLVTVWVVPLLFWITVATTLLNIVYYFKIYKNQPIKRVTVMLTVYFLITGFQYLIKYNMYGSNFRNYIFFYIMIFYYEFFRNKKIEFLKINFLLYLAAIAVQSTSLFLSIMLITSIYMYELFVVRSRQFYQLLIPSIPIIVYMILYYLYHQDYFVVLTLAFIVITCSILFLIKKIRVAINNFLYSKYCLYIITTSAIGLNLISFYMQFKEIDKYYVNLIDFQNYLIEYYSFKFDVSLSIFIINVFTFILRMGLIGTNIYCILNFNKLNSKMKFIIILQIYILVLFYNPFVCSIISKFGTGSVYFRTRALFMSMFLIAAIIVYLFNELENVKKYKNSIFILIFLGLITHLSLNVYQYYNNSYNTISNENPYNYSYRLYDDVVSAAFTLDSYISQTKEVKPKVLTPYFEISYLSNQFISPYHVELVRKKDNEEIQKENADVYEMIDMLDNSYYYTEEELARLKELVYRNDINFLITAQDISPILIDELKSFSKIIYQNTTYLVFEVY